jgi:hypothetical protein
MGEGIEHLDWIGMHRADEDFIDTIFRGFTAPALAHGTAPAGGAGNGTRDPNSGHLIALGREQRGQGINSEQ